MKLISIRQGRPLLESLPISLAVLLACSSMVFHIIDGSCLLCAALDVTLFGLAIVATLAPRVGLVILLAATAGVMFIPTEGRDFGPFAGLIPIFWQRPEISRRYWVLYSVAWCLTVTMIGVRIDGETDFFPYFLAFSALVAIAWFVSNHFHAARRLYDESKQESLDTQRQEIASDLWATASHGLALLGTRCDRVRVSRDPTTADIDLIAELANDIQAELSSILKVIQRSGFDHIPLFDEVWLSTPLEVALQEAKKSLEKNGFVVSGSFEGNSNHLRRGQIVSLAKLVKDMTTAVLAHGDRREACTIMISIESDAADLLFISKPSRRAIRFWRKGNDLINVTERVASLGGAVALECDQNRWITQVQVPISGENLPDQESGSSVFAYTLKS